MKHRPRPPEQNDLFRPRLVDMIDMRHELVTLAGLIDWEFFEREWAGFLPVHDRSAGDITAAGGGAALPAARLPALGRGGGRPLGGEPVLSAFHRRDVLPAQAADRSHLSHPVAEADRRRRGRMAADENHRGRAEIRCRRGRESGRDCCRHDSDGEEHRASDGLRLYERARNQLVDLARDAGIELRQSYARLAPRLAAQVGRYAHAKQFRRMRKALRTLRGYTGRVMRDLRRQLDEIPEGPLRERVLDKLVLVSRLLHQRPKDPGKIYSLHEPEVDCISKGKARVRYEFGCKVSIATTLKGGFVVGTRSLPGNPYDGHTLGEALGQVAILTGRPAKRAVVDRGYTGHGVEHTQVLISGTRRGLTPALAKALRRRSSIEPEIGHMKTDGRLSRCFLKGALGDALFAVLCGCGHNIRKILAHLRKLLAVVIALVLAAIRQEQRGRYSLAAA
jgi:IS5 family transposase